MKELIGRTIKKVWMGEGEEKIAFECDGATVGYCTNDECCSETWFADIVGMVSLIGSPVVSVDELEYSEDPKDGRTRQLVDSLYGFLIKTEKGSSTVIFRNSSNGYYGGGINSAIINPTLDNFKPLPINIDWSA
jgi:hypothetical protein